MAASTRPIPQPPTRRSADSVRRADRPVNVGDLERWLSLLGGGSWPSVRCGALWARSCSGQGRRPPVPRVDRALCAVPDHGPEHRVTRRAPDSSRSVAGPDEPPLVVVAES